MNGDIYRGYSSFFTTLEFNHGLGTEDSPIRITNEDDWRQIRNLLKSGLVLNNVFIELDSDLELTPADCWNGTIACKFNGQNHTITISPNKDEEINGKPTLSYIIGYLGRNSIIKNVFID